MARVEWVGAALALAAAAGCKAGDEAVGPSAYAAAVAAAAKPWEQSLGRAPQPGAIYRAQGAEALHKGLNWETAATQYKLAILADLAAGVDPAPEAVAGVVEAVAWGADPVRRSMDFRDVHRLVDNALGEIERAGAATPLAMQAWHLHRARALLLVALGTPGDALPSARAALAGSAADPRNQMALALAELDAGPEAALEKLSGAAAARPDSAPIASALGRAQLAARRHAEAAATFRRLVDEGVRPLHHRAQLAAALVAAGQDEEAARVLEALAGEGDADVWPGAELELADLLRRGGQSARAAARLSAAVARARREAALSATVNALRAHEALALCDEEQFEAADDASAEVLAVDASHALGNAAAALAALGKGGAADAESAAARARANAPAAARPALQVLEALAVFRQGRARRAIELMGEGDPRGSVSPVALKIFEAGLLAASGKGEAMERALAEAAAFTPDHDRDRRWTHPVRVERAIYGELERSFLNLVKSEPWMWQAQLGRAIALAQLGRWEPALRAFLDVSKRSEDAVGPQIYMAWRALDKDQAPTAAQWLEKVSLGKARLAPAAHVALGRVRASAGDKAGAADAFRAALGLDAGCTAAMLGLAQLAPAADEKASWLQKAAAADPTDLRVHRARYALASPAAASGGGAAK